MKILGIGNAIVDVICKVNDEFLTKNNLTKSTMKLVDEKEFKHLISSLHIEKTIAGGSVANSIVGLSQLKNEIEILELNNLSYDNLLLNILFILINKYIGNLKDFLHLVFTYDKVKQIEYLRESINNLNNVILKVYCSKYFYNGITFNMISDIFHNDIDQIVYKKMYLMDHNLVLE